VELSLRGSSLFGWFGFSFFIAPVSFQKLSCDRVSKLTTGNSLSNRQFSGRVVFAIVLFWSPLCRSRRESQSWDYQISEMNIDGQTFPTIFIFPEKVKKI
jgi:hypothetical protein